MKAAFILAGSLLAFSAHAEPHISIIGFIDQNARLNLQHRLHIDKAACEKALPGDRKAFHATFPHLTKPTNVSAVCMPAPDMPDGMQPHTPKRISEI